jgi:hypothetical protein
MSAMAEKPLADDDPMELVGIELPAGPSAMTEMAYVFAEEFARLGFDETWLLRVFRNRHYAGPHQAYRALGEPVIRDIVAECVRAWGGRPARTELPSTTPATEEGA